MNSTYNITLKLGALLSLPSRFIARIRRFDDFLNQDIHLPIDDSDAAISLTAAGVTAATHAGTRIYSTRPPPARDTIPYEFVAMPGPLAFLTSGYAVGLVTMVSCCRVIPRSTLVRENIIEVGFTGAPVEQDTTYRCPTASLLCVSCYA